jgi:DNA-binding NarL/FixJ family response regulator
LNILIADDHAAIRRSLRLLIEGTPGWTICADVSDGAEAVNAARELQPDIALIDLAMPGINGLEVTRQILRDAPHTAVVILTMYQSDELHDEVCRAGARALVVKSDAGESLVEAIRSTIAAAPMQLAGTTVGPIRHIGAFFPSESERERILTPFIAEGLRRGDRAYLIVNSDDHAHHRSHLRRSGLDVDLMESRQQMELASWETTYVRGGNFDGTAMLALVQEILVQGMSLGFPRTRGVAHMEWAATRHSNALIDYESRINHSIVAVDDVLVCAYDVSRFDNRTIDGAMRAHPAVVLDGRLSDNPYFGS